MNFASLKNIDFIIIGAARSGTSSLVKYLSNYNSVFIPLNVEPNFFFKDNEYKKGLEYYYNRFFSDAEEFKIIGEKSSSYLYGGKKTAKLIKKNFPDIKLVVLLRNPIERAYSNYLFTLKNNIEILDFNYAIKNENIRKNHYIGKWSDIKPFDYIGRSMYYQQVKDYLDIFDLKQMHFIIFEDLITNKKKNLTSLSKFLGFSYNPNIQFKKTNFTYSNIDIDKETYQYIYERISKDVDKLSNLLEKDLRNIWNL